ncbi:17635_t:CDS:1, partial [Racocetra fulgida]
MAQKMPENLQTSLEKAINKVKESKILKEVISDLKNLPEISDNQEVKKYFQELDQQLKEFEEKVLKIKNFNMIDLAFDILFSLASLKTEYFLFIEKVNSLDLESTFSNEIDWLIGEIDNHLKFLPKWNNCCIKITNQFEDLNNFVNNIKD